jgi:hypothetical protein
MHLISYSTFFVLVGACKKKPIAPQILFPSKSITCFLMKLKNISARIIDVIHSK